MNIYSSQISTLVCLIQLISCSILSAQECRSGSKPRHYKDDYAFLSSAYKKTTAEHFEACYIDCLAEVNCSSINYHLANGTCEFINVTKSCFPSRFVPQEKSIYAETRKQDGCRDLVFLDCLKDKALTGHVISNFSLQVPALKQCRHQCFLEGKCVSYNLGPVQGQNRSCELSAADHSTRRDFLVPKEGYEYYLIWNLCLSIPCPAGRLCTPDLSWDTFNCDDGGWTQWGPWNVYACRIPSTCRARKKTRKRTCTSPVPQNNGASCNGPALAIGECPQMNTTGCETPLGLEDGCIPDNQITASSTWPRRGSRPSLAPWYARLNQQKNAETMGAWAPARSVTGDHIQIDLGSVKVITKVATQGRPLGTANEQWVTKYSLSYSNKKKKWSNYKGNSIEVRVFRGNRDRTTVVTNKLEVPIRARHIRLIVKGIYGHANLRMELYGCSKA